MGRIDKLKRHGALPLIALALVCIVWTAVHTYGLREREAVTLRDLSGSREALAGSVVSGLLEDGYHRTAFRIQGGRESAETKVFAQPHWREQYAKPAGAPGGTDDGPRYSIQNTLSTYKIMSQRWQGASLFPAGYTEVAPPIVYHDPEGRSDVVTLANEPEYGLALIGDRAYFTVPASAYFTGKSGIYELQFFDLWYQVKPGNKTFPVRKLAEIDLDGNDTARGRGIEVLGLEATGGRLALLTVERGSLIVRSYDPDSGAMLGETAVPGFGLSGRDNGAGSAADYREPYEAYPDAARGLLTLSFDHASDVSKRTVFVFDLSDGVKLTQRFELGMSDGERDNDGPVSAMNYRDGKLYAVKSWREPRDIDGVPGLPPQRKHVYVYVYGGSGLLYKGELESGLGDDDISLAGARDDNAYSSRHRMSSRRFADISVLAAAPAEKEVAP